MRRLKGVKANRRAGGMAFTLIPREHVAEILTSEPRPPAAPVATGLWAAACEVEHSIMGVTVDHVAIPAREPRLAADFLAEILGLGPATPDGADHDMFNLALADGSALLFASSPTVASQHMAFRMTEAEFAAVVGRLRARGIAFGNDPDDPTTGQTDDPLGGRGRVYFQSPDGHLFEATA